MEAVRRLREIQRAARALRRDAQAPVVERVAQIIETECHLARWALGDVRGMTPESASVEHALLPPQPSLATSRGKGGHRS